MELVRNLPASDAAPDLARSAVDLAVGHDVHPETADQVRDLTGELLAESAPRVDSETMELRVRADAGSVRVEVAWTGEPPGSGDDPNDGPRFRHLQPPTVRRTQTGARGRMVDRMQGVRDINVRGAEMLHYLRGVIILHQLRGVIWCAAVGRSATPCTSRTR